jgi:hypothetical protein
VFGLFNLNFQLYGWIYPVSLHTLFRDKENSVALVRKQTISTERLPHVGEVSATFADSGCRVVGATDPHGRIFGFLDRSRYYFFQVAPQLYSRGWVDPVPDPLLLRKSGSAGNRTWDLWICNQEIWPLDHRGGLFFRDKAMQIRHEINDRCMLFYL